MGIRTPFKIALITTLIIANIIQSLFIKDLYKKIYKQQEHIDTIVKILYLIALNGEGKNDQITF